MVTTRNMTTNDKNTQVGETSQPDPMTLILQMRKDMEMLKKKNEEEIQGRKRKSEQEIEALRRQNAWMKQKLNGEPTTLETIKGELPPTKHIDTRTQEVGNSYQENTRLASTNTLGTTPRRSPFLEAIIEVPLSSTWNNPTLDKYDGTTNLDEHVNAYLTQVSL